MIKRRFHTDGSTLSTVFL